MLTEYIRRAMAKAKYEIIDGGTFYGEIPGLQGVLAIGDTLEGCRTELQSVLEEWIVLKLRHGDAIPEVDGIGFADPVRKTA